VWRWQDREWWKPKPVAVELGSIPFAGGHSSFQAGIVNHTHEAFPPVFQGHQDRVLRDSSHKGPGSIDGIQNPAVFGAGAVFPKLLSENPVVGNSRSIIRRKLSSALRSAIVTGELSALLSTRISPRKYSKVIFPAS